MQCPRVRGERRGSPRGSAGRAGRQRRARGPTCAGRGAAAPPAGAVPPRPAAAAPRPGAASSPPGGRTPRRDSAQRRPPRSSLGPGRLHPTQKVAGRDVFGGRQGGPGAQGRGRAAATMGTCAPPSLQPRRQQGAPAASYGRPLDEYLKPDGGLEEGGPGCEEVTMLPC